MTRNTAIDTKHSKTKSELVSNIALYMANERKVFASTYSLTLKHRLTSNRIMVIRHVITKRKMNGPHPGAIRSARTTLVEST